MKAQPSVTVVILTYNEERNLSTCLEAVQWADDLLVVDSGSQDQTLAIAQRYRARILIHQADPFLISEQRNYALDAGDITTEWVLFIDADEIVTAALHRELEQTIAAAPAQLLAYRLAPKFMFLGSWLKYCQAYPVWHDRLLRAGQVRFQGGVWESFALAEPSARVIGYLQEPYLHYSVNKGIGDWFSKHNRYATVEALDILTTLGQPITAPLASQRTTRKRKWRNLAAHVWPLRPLLRFLVMYIGQRGFLDGRPGLLYSLMIACYEFMIVLKVIEFRRRQQGLPL